MRMCLPVSERPCPHCGQYYDTSDPAASYPHNNH